MQFGINAFCQPDTFILHKMTYATLRNGTQPVIAMLCFTHYPNSSKGAGGLGAGGLGKTFIHFLSFYTTPFKINIQPLTVIICLMDWVLMWMFLLSLYIVVSFIFSNRFVSNAKTIFWIYTGYFHLLLDLSRLCYFALCLTSHITFDMLGVRLKTLFGKCEIKYRDKSAWI